MKKLLVLGLMSLYTFTSVFAQSDLQPLVTIKLHKTESITLKQLKERVEVFEKQSGTASFTVEDKKSILESMIDEKLVVQAATKAGMNLTDTMVDQAFAQSLSQQVGQNVTEQQFAAIVREQMGMSLDDYFMSQAGMNVAKYKVFLKDQIIAQQYIMSLKQAELQQNTTVSDTDIRSFFEINKSAFAQNDIMKLFLVVVPKGNNPSGAKTLANSLQADLKANKVTTDELRIKMQDPSAGYQAGDMFVSKGTLAAEQLGIDYDVLLDLFTKNIGHLDDVKETAVDFQFFVIQEKYPAKLLQLDDLVQPDTTVTVYEYIRSQLSQQKQALAFQDAVLEVTSSLKTPENYQMLKTDSVLNNLLNW